MSHLSTFAKNLTEEGFQKKMWESYFPIWGLNVSLDIIKID